MAAFALAAPVAGRGLRWAPHLVHAHRPTRRWRVGSFRAAAARQPPTSDDAPLLLSVDIGTGSVRAGLFTRAGVCVGRGEHATRTRNAKAQHYEQSTEDIWAALVAAVRGACGNKAHLVEGMAVDATCSLVASDAASGEALSVVASSRPEESYDGLVWDVVLWLDQRSTDDALHINEVAKEEPAVGHVVDAFGGAMSPELEHAKLRHLIRELPGTTSRARFDDLADWVTWRLTGRLARSTCTTAGKWGRSKEHGWDDKFWADIGVPEIRSDRGGKEMTFHVPGECAGGLRKEVAEQLALPECCAVGVPMVDAHCGAIGMLGARCDGALVNDIPLDDRVAVLAGTSTCFIRASKIGMHVNGLWGPFCDALIGDGMWCTEAGQNTTGHLLAHLVTTHAAYPDLVERVGKDAVFEELNRIVEQLVEEGDGKDPAQDVHILDSFAGNRSPHGDPTLRGMISGLELSATTLDLAVLYLAAVQAICYGARSILERMDEMGKVRLLLMAGSQAKNALIVQTLADITRRPVALSSAADPTLLGGAVLAACAAGTGAASGLTLEATMRRMTEVSRVVEPRDATRRRHNAKYRVYQLLHQHFAEYRRVMGGAQFGTAIES